MPVPKAIVKQAREKLLVLGQGDKAVADVARGRDAKFAPQLARTATLIRDSNYRCGPQDVRLEPRWTSRFRDMELEPPQEGREAGASSDGDDLHNSNRVTGVRQPVNRVKLPLPSPFFVL